MLNKENPSEEYFRSQVARTIKSAVRDLLGKNRNERKRSPGYGAWEILKDSRVARSRRCGSGHRSDEETIRRRRSAERQLRSFLLPLGTSCTVMNKGGWESRTIERRVPTFTFSHSPPSVAIAVVGNLMDHLLIVMRNRSETESENSEDFLNNSLTIFKFLITKIKCITRVKRANEPS